MSDLVQGIIAGTLFGFVSVAAMIPIELQNKKSALGAAFVNRFGIGLLVAISAQPSSGWLRGLLIGILLSLPDAIIAKAYAPIVGIGAVGGLVIGFVVQ